MLYDVQGIFINSKIIYNLLLKVIHPCMTVDIINVLSTYYLQVILNLMHHVNNLLIEVNGSGLLSILYCINELGFVCIVGCLGYIIKHAFIYLNNYISLIMIQIWFQCSVLKIC